MDNHSVFHLKYQSIISSINRTDNVVNYFMMCKIWLLSFQLTFEYIVLLKFLFILFFVPPYTVLRSRLQLLRIVSFGYFRARCTKDSFGIILFEKRERYIASDSTFMVHFQLILIKIVLLVLRKHSSWWLKHIRSYRIQQSELNMTTKGRMDLVQHFGPNAHIVNVSSST